jgi:hypothetical protein
MGYDAVSLGGWKPFKVQRNIPEDMNSTILSVILCGCETWSLILREELWLRIFENKVLWKIFGHKKEDVTEG